jgi:hypothetical protein
VRFKADTFAGRHSSSSPQHSTAALHFCVTCTCSFSLAISADAWSYCDSRTRWRSATALSSVSRSAALLTAAAANAAFASASCTLSLAFASSARLLRVASSAAACLSEMAASACSTHWVRSWRRQDAVRRRRWSGGGGHRVLNRDLKLRLPYLEALFPLGQRCRLPGRFFFLGLDTVLLLLLRQLCGVLLADSFAFPPRQRVLPLLIRQWWTTRWRECVIMSVRGAAHGQELLQKQIGLT